MSEFGISDHPEERLKEVISYIQAVVQDCGIIDRATLEHWLPVIKLPPDNYVPTPHCLHATVVDSEAAHLQFTVEQPYLWASLKVYGDSQEADEIVPSMENGGPVYGELLAYSDLIRVRPGGELQIQTRIHVESMDAGPDADPVFQVWADALGLDEAQAAPEAVLEVVRRRSLEVGTSSRTQYGWLSPQIFSIVPPDSRPVQLDAVKANIDYKKEVTLTADPDAPRVTLEAYEFTADDNTWVSEDETTLKVESVTDGSEKRTQLIAVSQNVDEINPATGDNSRFATSIEERVAMLAPMLTAAVRYDITATALNLAEWRTMKLLGGLST